MLVFKEKKEREEWWRHHNHFILEVLPLFRLCNGVCTLQCQLTFIANGVNNIFDYHIKLNLCSI